MTELVFAMGTALWLGILTSISPCPMATNIAAMSYIGRRIDQPTYVLWSGLSYILGQSIAYFVLGCIIVTSLLNTPQLSFFLQKYMYKILGPLLIIVGMFLCELITINLHSNQLSQWVQKRTETWGLMGAFMLGAAFALSFCPVTAAIFFGTLIPLAVQHQSGLFLPLFFGIGAALPEVIFAILLALGAHSLSITYNKITQFEFWARRITGVIFILVGIYLSLNQLI